MLAFTKMNGAGNDFVMVDNRCGTLPLQAEIIARLCDRHRGIGGDGLIAAEAAEEEADAAEAALTDPPPTPEAAPAALVAPGTKAAALAACAEELGAVGEGA